MAHLFQYQLGNWQPVSLTGPALGWSPDGKLRPAQPTEDVPIRLRGAGREWVLLAAPATQVRVNGEAVRSGCRLLRDRDEIVVFGGMRAFYSTERLACVEAFPGAADKVCCVRCKQGIEAGSASVRCPGCGRWYHQGGELQCWTYSPVCSLCPRPTGLGEGFQWVPEF